ncbi:MAG: PAS domain-containing protein, partial [Armatimonadota bacterium]
MSPPIPDTAEPIIASFLLHLDGCITSWSPAVEQMFRYSSQEWIGQPESLLYPPGSPDLWEQDRAQAELTGSASSVRVFVTQDGAPLRADAVLTALYNSSGSLMGFSRTLRTKTDAADSEVESRLQLAAEAAQVGTWDYSPITGSLQWDNRCRAAYGLPPDAPVDYDTFLAGIHPQDRARADDAVQRALRGENRGEYEIEFRTIGLEDGGSLRWVAARGRAFFNANGVAERFIGTLIDITGRRLTEEALRERDDRYTMVTRATRDAIWDWDLITNVVRWNEGVVSLFGYQPGEVVSTADWWYDHIHPDDRIRVVDSIHTVIDHHSGDGHSWTGEYRFRCRDGSYSLVLDRGYIMRDEDGNPLRMIGAMQDVTERRRAEEALREREEFLRRIIESSPDCIKTMDLDGRILSINEGGQQVLEVDDPADICGADWLTLWDDETRTDVQAAIQTAKQGGHGRFQGYSPTMKGTPRWWDVVVVAILAKDGSPEYLLGISRDITEQRRAAEQ